MPKELDDQSTTSGAASSDPYKPMVVYVDKRNEDEEPAEKGSGKGWVFAAGGLALLVAGAGGVALASGGDSEPAVEERLAATDEEVASPEAEGEPTDQNPTSSSTSPSTAQPVEETPDSNNQEPAVENPGNDTPDSEVGFPRAAPADYEGRAYPEVSPELLAKIARDNPETWTITTRDDKTILAGKVASQERSDFVVESLAQLVGAENIFNDFVIDPSTPLDADSPVYSDNNILFDTGSAVVTEQFQVQLDRVNLLFAINPTVKVHIIGHTDDVGDRDANQVLSQARLDAALEYLRSVNADMSRVTVEARGQDDPIADNSTAEGRALNRRLEYVISGFFG